MGGGGVDMMRVSVRFFAVLREMTGTDSLEVELKEGSLSTSVIDELASRFPRLREWKSHVRIAVNREYAENDCELHDGDEVALLPPVSGG